MVNKTNRIVFVSRLDADCSHGAHLLCSIASLLYEKLGNVEIVIVGGGSEYPAIKCKAAIINEKHNHRLISATGNVEDPSVYFSGNSLFVGVSRAALEAMSHGLAVILLGNEGYLGILNENNLEGAVHSNFTCRGTRLADSWQLFDDIVRFFALPEKRRAQLSAFSKNIIKHGYTAEKMAQKTLGVYQKTIEKYRAEHPLRVTLCGYYGNGNFGDDEILRALLGMIKGLRKEARVSILRPKNPIKSIKDMLGADLFIFGGGSLLQNATSSRSLVCYLFMIALAKGLCKKRIMLSNGFGPIKDDLISEKAWLGLVSLALSCFDHISARDTLSQNALSKLSKNKKVYLLPDLTIPNLLKINRKLNFADEDSKKEIKDKPYFVFCPHAQSLMAQGVSEDMLVLSLKSLARIFDARIRIAVLNKNQDLGLAISITKMIENSDIVLSDSAYTLAKCFADSEFVISQRYHGTLLSTCAMTPTVAVSSDPKMLGLCRDLFLDPPHSASILKDAALLLKAIMKALNTESERKKNTISALEKYGRIVEKFDWL